MNFKTVISKRLDLEFSLFLGTCVAVLVAFGLFGGLWLSEVEQKKAANVERQYIESQLASFKEKVIGDILLDHHEAIRVMVEQTRQDLNLNSLTIEYQGHEADSRADRKVQSLISSESSLMIGDRQLATLAYESGSKLQGTTGKVLYFVLLVFFIFIIILSVFVSRWLQTRFFDPIRELISMCGKDNALDELQAFKPSSVELEILREQFSILVQDQRGKQQKITLLEKRKSVAELAQQVAHDIRSPLTALNVLLVQTEYLPEDIRMLMRSAATRIRDIANNLLSSSEVVSANPPKKTVGVHLVSAVIESMVSEKRLQYRDKPNAEIALIPCREAYGQFSSIDVIEFRRVLSNLINNALESYGEGGGPVSLELRTQDEGFLSIEIIDEGSGIPEDVLGLLGEPGVTHGKSFGHGLGVSHSKRTIESWGGTLSFKSLVGRGTCVTILLKQAPPPKWFLPVLNLSLDKSVVILDDDDAVHQTWDRLLAPFVEKGLTVISFRLASDLELWLEKNMNTPFTGLFDHELIGQQTSGLDIIEHYSLQRAAVLVTSRYEEGDFLEECEAQSIRVVPKGLVGMLPVRWETLVKKRKPTKDGGGIARPFGNGREDYV